MLIIWGTKGFQKVLGELGVANQCGRCNNVTNGRIIRVRRWFTLFWIPIFPVGTKYFLLCPICSQGRQLKKAEAEGLLQQYGNRLQ